MKYNYKILFFLGLIYCLVGTVSAQERTFEKKLKKADKAFTQFEYSKAINMYLELAETPVQSTALYQRLGDVYYMNGNYQEAHKWYQALFTIDVKTIPAVYYLRYAQSLKSIGKDELANSWYSHYTIATNQSSEAIDKGKQQILDTNEDIEITPVPFNTSGVDMLSTYGINGEVYVTSSKMLNNDRNTHNTWAYKEFLDIYTAQLTSTMQIDNIKALHRINGKYHEANPVITKDGNTMYFTKNHLTSKGINQLYIYKAQLVDGQWDNIQPLSINMEDYMTAYPALNPNEDRLYFVSNRPGTIGSTDIFSATIGADGTLGTVTNLGDVINTIGRESFPFINANNEFYFTSDGHYGLGGYDIYYTQLLNEVTPETLYNLGTPVNSSYDDMGFITLDEQAFFSSNRPGGKGFDDIYSVQLKKPIHTLLKKQKEGHLLDEVTGMPIKNADIILLDSNKHEIAQTRTNDQGQYSVEVDAKDRVASIKVRANGYESKEVPSNQNILQNITLKQQEVASKKMLSDATTSSFEAQSFKVYYNYNETTITKDSESTLEALLKLLQQYPETFVKIEAHTDARGSNAYNLELSQKRALAVERYLVEHGVKVQRITSQSFGEEMLSNKCTEIAECTELEHSANRRSEIYIRLTKE